MDKVTRYRFALALLSGAGIASVLTLLLNLPVAILATVLLLPGAIPAAFLSRSQGFGPPLGILAADGFVYSIAAYVLIATVFRKVTAAAMRLAAIRLVLPVTILIGLACVPTLNPLWPRGMAALARQEFNLQQALPMGTTLDTAHLVLRSKGIQFGEYIEPRESVILNDERGTSIIAAPGDHVLSAQLRTDATEYPCSYDIQLVLLFGPDEKMHRQYIHRLRLCP